MISHRCSDEELMVNGQGATNTGGAGTAAGGRGCQRDVLELAMGPGLDAQSWPEERGVVVENAGDVLGNVAWLAQYRVAAFFTRKYGRLVRGANVSHCYSKHQSLRFMRTVR